MGSDSDLAAAGAGAGGGLRRVPGGGHHGPHHALPRRARAGLRADFGMNCDDIDEDAMMMTMTMIKDDDDDDEDGEHAFSACSRWHVH